MKLSGLELTSSIRMTQAADALDIELNLLSTNTPVDPVFYSTLFFDMLNGDVTGVIGGSATPGFVIKVYNTDNTLFTTSDVATLDWYETENGYISEAITTKTQAIASNTHIRKIELYYYANESDTNKEVLVASSEEIGRSNFATADSNGVLGIPLLSANGAVDFSCTTQFVIAI